MKLKSFMLILVLFAAVFSTSMFGYIYGVGNNVSHSDSENIPAVQTEYAKDVSAKDNQAEAEITVKDFKESYVLRETDGKLALFIKFANGDEELYNSYDVSVSLLPRSDREELKRGIELSSLNEALQLVEDYVE